MPVGLYMDWLEDSSVWESSESIQAILQSSFKSSKPTPRAKVYKLVELKKGERGNNLCVRFPASQFSCNVIEEMMTDRAKLQLQVDAMKLQIADMQAAMNHSDEVRIEALGTVNLLKDEFTNLMQTDQTEGYAAMHVTEQPRNNAIKPFPGPPLTNRARTPRLPLSARSPIELKLGFSTPIGSHQLCQTARISSKQKELVIGARRIPKPTAWSIRKP